LRPRKTVGIAIQSEGVPTGTAASCATGIEVGPRLAAALVNAESLSEFGGLLVEHQIRRPWLSSVDREALDAWVSRLRPVFLAEGVDERCAAVNALLSDVAGALFLTTHDETPPHLHLVADERDVVARVQSVTATGLAFFLAWSGGGRLGTCARSRCGRAYVDASKAGRQRYCSARCGNTDAVARHRASAVSPT